MTFNYLNKNILILLCSYDDTSYRLLRFIFSDSLTLLILLLHHCRLLDIF